VRSVGVGDVRTTDEGLFGPSSVTWRIHGDPAMVLGGLRALLLQAVHPLTMAGFDANSTYRDDPWGRLQRTGAWVGAVTFGSTDEAEAAGARLRAVHARLRPGVEPETGLAYRVDDPELLRWVHCTEVESFLDTYRRSGGMLAPGDADRYVAEMRESARLVGLDPASVPCDQAGLGEYFANVRPDLRVTAVARRGALWGFVPPMPLWVQVATPARVSWAALVAIAAGLLPRWARRLYGLPGWPTTDLTAQIGAQVVRRSLLALPNQWIESPAHAAALSRLDRVATR
jgi:uncharacterized protein (DUF2236 family)